MLNTAKMEAKQVSFTPLSTFKSIIKKLWTLKRVHLFEFCDQPWLSGVWREAYLDGLNTTFKLFKFHNSLAAPFKNWLSQTKNKQVFEFCSGGGGPVDTLLKDKSLSDVTFTLSDFNPDLDAFCRMKYLHKERIRFISNSVDATNATEVSSKMIFMCSSFHHFSQDQAKKILQNAYANSEGIFIREILSRNMFNTVCSVFNIIPLMLTPFFSKRFSFYKFLIMTVIPIVPVMVIFDGIVSVLRTYTNEEILQLMPDDMKKKWIWKTGSNKVCGLLKAPYIYGVKK